MMSRRTLARIAAAALVIAAVAIYAARNLDRPLTARRDGVAMDTYISVSVSAPRGAMSEGELNGALAEVFGMLASLDRELSMTDPDSALSRLASAKAGEPFAVPPDLFAATETALEMAEITGGAYDPTIGSVTAAWRGPGGFSVPADDALARALSFVGIENVTLDRPNKITIAKRGTRLDFGGIGKGYASARAAEALRARGVPSALLDFGGNIVTIGGRPDGGDWRIGVQHPDEPRGTPLVSVSANGTAVITAGTYERVWEEGDRRYTHIYDPATGRPVDGPLVSATVVTDDPAAGDALSTAFVVLGVRRSLELLKGLPDAEAIFVERDEGSPGGLRVTATDGLRGSLTAFSPYRVEYAAVR